MPFTFLNSRPKTAIRQTPLEHPGVRAKDQAYGCEIFALEPQSKNSAERADHVPAKCVLHKVRWRSECKGNLGINTQSDKL
jgi:hypothetical protein